MSHWTVRRAVIRDLGSEAFCFIASMAFAETWNTQNSAEMLVQSAAWLSIYLKLGLMRLEETPGPRLGQNSRNT